MRFLPLSSVLLLAGQETFATGGGGGGGGEPTAPPSAAPLASGDADAAQGRRPPPTTATSATTDVYEYDYTILDPLSAFGTPYGGWSRATRSRLTALPLVLPVREGPTESEPEPLHLEVRDAEGQRYACRVYAEHELEPESLMDGMFEPPRLRQLTDAAATEGPIQEPSVIDRGETSISDGMEEIVEIGPDGTMLVLPRATRVGEGELNALASQDVLDVLSINALLGQLHGVCSHLHHGWWSYEWCFEQYVAQFHIALENDALKVSDFVKLGEFVSRTIHTDLSGMTVNELAGEEKEIGRVIETYSGGTTCPDTGNPRSSTVTLVCCSKEVMTKDNKSSLKKESDGVDGIAKNSGSKTSVYKVEETEICSYDIIVCTPILCKEDSSRNEAIPEQIKIVSGTKVHPLGKSRPPKPNESVREILDRTLGGVCLQTATGGWWTYEFCHGVVVRQFHDEIGVLKTSRGTTFTSRVVEAEHILGKYPSDVEPYPNDLEHKHVVNATGIGNSIERGGNGAYFEVEYVDGNVCDESDVTERAIVAGGATSSKIRRASSIRYYCGSSFFVSVSEDSTCHYIVQVTVPDLCSHTLFKAPATTRQVMKCLPVDDANLDGTGYIIET